jgi:site-specific DNA-cytosine methylase
VVQLTKHSSYLTIINKLSSLGYHLHQQIINAKELGVKQNRERLFIFAGTTTKKLIDQRYYQKNKDQIKRKRKQRYRLKKLGKSSADNQLSEQSEQFFKPNYE